MKKPVAICFFLTLCGLAWAKRPDPALVTPVQIGGLEFAAPNQNGRKGIIRITEISTGISKDVVVYKNFIWPLLEEDVQWDFVKRLAVSDAGFLIIETEDGRKFTFDPDASPKRRNRK